MWSISHIIREQEIGGKFYVDHNGSLRTITLKDDDDDDDKRTIEMSNFVKKIRTQKEKKVALTCQAM